MKKANKGVEADLAILGKVLKRVASAADRNVPGIFCQRVGGAVDGMQYEVPGLGSLYFGDDGFVILTNRSNQPIVLNDMPDIGRVGESLRQYYQREQEERQKAGMADSRILHETVEEVKNWRPRELTKAVREQERFFKESQVDDGNEFPG